jgi:alcohol dehydrogenase YqhD (iron-dependent ADH family)
MAIPLCCVKIVFFPQKPLDRLLQPVFIIGSINRKLPSAMIANSGEYRKKNGQRGYVMMNNFIFENKTKVYFGKGGVKEYLGGLLANFGETVMLAYGGGSIKCNGVYDEIMGILNAQGKCVVEFSGIMSNPTYAKVQDGAKLARENHVDLILAVGGGSVSDCCKVISAQANLNEDIWEMQYTKHTLPTKFIPLGTIVTVFGTGSEMNNGAVITHEEKKIKGALWGAQAEFAFLDPAYSLSVPMQQVISGAFDTLSHAMETYFGKPDENNLSDDTNEAAMAENGVLKIGKVTDFQAHQIEHQLGAYTNCNHGASLAVIHPVLYRHIYKSGAARFARFAQNVWASHPRAVTGKPPPVSTRWPRSLRKSVCRPALQSLAFPLIPISVPSRIPPTSPLAAAKS